MYCGALNALQFEHLLGWLDELRRAYDSDNSNGQVNE